MPYEIKDIDNMHPFLRQIKGVWSNRGLPRQDNGLPYSCNVMPLPQERAEPGLTIQHDGYILKNFTYTEVITFHGHPDAHDPETTPTSALPAAAPNRGYQFRQVPNALFYDQIVRFAEGPAYDQKKGVGSVVHVENGAWLQLQKQPVAYGPYPPKGTDPNPQTDSDFAKMISVPHGNSILAYGAFTGLHQGAPKIPSVSVLPTLPAKPHQAPQPYPAGRYDEKLDTPEHYENPNPVVTKDPTRPLRDLIGKLGIQEYYQVDFQTQKNDAGNMGYVTNIEFEEKMASACDYDASYWLMRGKNDIDFKYLAYYQNIILELVIKGQRITFPHVTANVVTIQGPA